MIQLRAYNEGFLPVPQEITADSVEVFTSDSERRAVSSLIDSHKMTGEGGLEEEEEEIEASFVLPMTYLRILLRAWSRHAFHLRWVRERHTHRESVSERERARKIER